MKKNILFFGFIHTLGSTITVLYALHFNPSISMGALHGLGSWILVGIITGYFYKKQKNVIPSFRNIFIVVLGALTLGVVLSTIITILYYGTLTDETKLLLENKYLEARMGDLESITNITRFQDNIEKDADRLFDIANQLISIPMGIIISSFIAAIVALFMKKEINTERALDV